MVHIPEHSFFQSASHGKLIFFFLMKKKKENSSEKLSNFFFLKSSHIHHSKLTLHFGHSFKFFLLILESNNNNNNFILPKKKHLKQKFAIHLVFSFANTDTHTRRYWGTVNCELLIHLRICWFRVKNYSQTEMQTHAFIGCVISKTPKKKKYSI